LKEIRKTQLKNKKKQRKSRKEKCIKEKKERNNRKTLNGLARCDAGCAARTSRAATGSV
jgi:hypothetical protein